MIPQRYLMTPEMKHHNWVNMDWWRSKNMWKLKVANDLFILQLSRQSYLCRKPTSFSFELLAFPCAFNPNFAFSASLSIFTSKLSIQFNTAAIMVEIQSWTMKRESYLSRSLEFLFQFIWAKFINIQFQRVINFLWIKESQRTFF